MKKILLTVVLVLFTLGAVAQEQKSEKEREKEFYEYIDKEVEKYADNLDLADWQIFYLDSILTHNYVALRDELSELGKAKVANSDHYYRVQDKWMEESYNAIHKILNEEQWEKYGKMGAAREKKARDKRAAKTQKGKKQ